MVLLVSTLVKTFCAVVNLASMAIFKSVAALLVLAIHALKVPSFAIGVILKQVVEILHFAVRFMVQFLLNLLFNIANALVEILLNSVTGLAAAVRSGVTGLMGMTKSSLTDITSMVTELIHGLSGVMESISVVWNNFLGAVQYFMEKV